MQNTELKKKKRFTSYKRRFRMFQVLLSQDFVRFRKIMTHRTDKKSNKTILLARISPRIYFRKIYLQLFSEK